MKHSQCPFLLANKISCFAVRKGYILCPRTMEEFQPAALPSHSETLPRLCPANLSPALLRRGRSAPPSLMNEG